MQGDILKKEEWRFKEKKLKEKAAETVAEAEAGSDENTSINVAMI